MDEYREQFVRYDEQIRIHFRQNVRCNERIGSRKRNSPIAIDKSTHQAYVAMYARWYSRNGVRRYRMDEYLFRVEGPTLAETLLCFGQRLSDLQAAEIIQGRYLCADKVETSHRMLLQENLYNKIRELHYKTRK